MNMLSIPCGETEGPVQTPPVTVPVEQPAHAFRTR